MISFERSEKEIKEKKEPTSPISLSRPTATAKPFSVSQLEFQRIKGKIKFCSQICSCFVSADCQIHFTRATDFFKITQET